MESKRNYLIEQGFIIDPPVVKRFNNRHRKDGLLTTEQIESLKANYGILASKMREKDVLPVLRKRYKHYKFTKVFLDINSLN
jgi:hypothetical protein